MKRTLLWTLTAVLMLTVAGHAENFGSTFGALTTAQAVGRGETFLGGRVGVAEATSIVGSLTRGLSDIADGRFKAGFIDDELFKTELILGADLKWQVWNVLNVAPDAETRPPFDLAIGPFVEWVSFDFDDNLILESQTVFQIGGQVVGSYPFHLQNGALVSPYGRLNVRHESLSTETAPGIDDSFAISDSHLALGFNGGVAWRPRGTTTLLYAEIQIDGNDGLFLGADFRL